MTSLDSSTTHSTVSSRRGSRQMLQVSSSVTLKHTEQNFTLSLTARMASASRFMSSGSASRTWKAIRWADLGPMPGSRPNSSISSWTAPSYTKPHTALSDDGSKGNRPEGPTGEDLDDRGAVVVALLDQAAVEQAFDRRPADHPGFLDGDVIIAGNVLNVPRFYVPRAGLRCCPAAGPRTRSGPAGPCFPDLGLVEQLLVPAHRLARHLLRCPVGWHRGRRRCAGTRCRCRSRARNRCHGSPRCRSGRATRCRCCRQVTGRDGGRPVGLGSPMA